MDLLSQFEYQEHHPNFSHRPDLPRPPTTHFNYQPLSVQDSRSPMHAMYAVMAARVAEEEQVQRVMMSLNDTRPTYPLKSEEEVQRVFNDLYPKPSVKNPPIFALHTKVQYNLIATLQDVVIKTLLVANPHLVHSYSACRPGRAGRNERSQCFEILGFDVLLDSELNPWLLEVNRSPSFGTDAQLDLVIKTGVIRDALNILNLR